MSEPFESWAVLELLGHVRTGGKVSEAELFGAKMGRIEIPQGDGFVTQFFGGASVYRLTPCGEAEARAAARSSQHQPLNVFGLPALPAREPYRDPYVDPDPDPLDEDEFDAHEDSDDA